MSALGRLRAAAAPTVRSLRTKYDDPELRQARLLMRRVRRGPISVLHFGASESIFVSLEDEDLRALPGLIRHALVDPTGYHPVIGAGYPPRLCIEYLRLTEPYLEKPPVVLIAIPVRIALGQWYDHPRYGYGRSLERVKRVSPKRPPALVRRRPLEPTPEDFAAYDAVPLPSFIGDHPRGYYRKALRSPESVGITTEADIDRLRYAYFWGGVEPVLPAFLAELTTLGQYLRDKGFSVVPYQVPIPFEQGTRVWPGYREYVTEAVHQVEDAFRAGYGDVAFGQAGLSVAEEFFIDPGDASEHVRFGGRKPLADELVARLSAINPALVAHQTT